jgi:hypothetical protein
VLCVDIGYGFLEISSGMSSLFDCSVRSRLLERFLDMLGTSDVYLILVNAHSEWDFRFYTGRPLCF